MPCECREGSFNVRDDPGVDRRFAVGIATRWLRASFGRDRYRQILSDLAVGVVAGIVRRDLEDRYLVFGGDAMTTRHPSKWTAQRWGHGEGPLNA